LRVAMSQEVQHTGAGIAVADDEDASGVPVVNPSHAVLFYDDEELLVRAVARFIAASLGAGERALVFAAPERRRALARHLAARAMAAEGAMAFGRLELHDAAALLDRILVDGHPDPARFEEVVARAIERCLEDGARARVYGEMVDLLWRGGNGRAAIEL